MILRYQERPCRRLTLCGDLVKNFVAGTYFLSRRNRDTYGEFVGIRMVSLSLYVERICRDTYGEFVTICMVILSGYV